MGVIIYLQFQRIGRNRSLHLSQTPLCLVGIHNSSDRFRFNCGIWSRREWPCAFRCGIQTANAQYHKYTHTCKSHKTLINVRINLKHIGEAEMHG